MAKEIERIIGNVSEAKSRLVETGKTADAVELKEIERDLMQMKRSITNGAYGWADRAYESRYLDREVIWRLEDLERLSDKIRFMASSPYGDGVGREIDILKAGIGRVEGDLRNGRSEFL